MTLVLRVTRSAALVSLLVALPAAAQAAEPMLFFPPGGATTQATELGYLVHARAERLLIEEGAGPVVNLRQILSAAEALHLPVHGRSARAAERIANVLGAKRYVVAQLRGTGPSYSLELAVIDDGKAAAPAVTVLRPPLSSAVLEAARALAAQALGRPLTTTDPEPLAIRDAAVVSWATCSAALLAQPILLDSPSTLHTEDLTRAMTACRETIALAPQLDEAKASLGLALALSERTQDAVDTIRAVPTKRYEPALWLAHYWLAVRHRSPAAGLAVLQEVVRRFPSSLLAHSLLADHLFATRQYEAALPTAEAIATLLPRSSISRARVSAVLARLGRNEEALRVAVECARLAPDDPRNLTTVASRYLDAGRYEEALTTLAPLLRQEPSARVLDLQGWALLRLGRLDEAQRAFESARTATDSARYEWRTRGRAHAGLLRVASARPDEKLATRVALQVQAEGFVAFLRALNDPAVTTALDRVKAPQTDLGVAPKKGRVRGARYIRPAEATPFSLDPTGDIDPRSRALTSPGNQVELLRF